MPTVTATVPMLTPPLIVFLHYAQLAGSLKTELKNIPPQKKTGSYYYKFSNTLIDQKSPDHAVPVADGGGRQQTTDSHCNSVKIFKNYIQFYFCVENLWLAFRATLL